MLTSFFLLAGFTEKEEQKGAERLIKAVIIWNLWSYFLVEILSLFNYLTKTGIMCGWIIFDIILLVDIIFRKKKIHIKCIKFTPFLVPIYIAVIVVSGLALVTVPYNWDSMTYHLPRIVHWANNQSVAHYATNDIRQLVSPVLAEFINVQVYILTGNRDNFLNLLQAGSYLVCALMVYHISVKLKCEKKYSVMAMLLFMTMPIAFGEAINTQVDLFATLWLLFFTYHILDLFKEEHLVWNRRNIKICIILAICVGFGYLSKPTVLVGMAVMLLLLLVKCLKRQDQILGLVKMSLMAILIVLLLVLPEMGRNYQTLGAISTPAVGANQMVGTIRPNYLIVNWAKNFVHSIPSVYLYDSQELVYKFIVALSAVLHVDMNDASISEGGMDYKIKMPPSYNHDMSTSPVILILAIMGIVWCLLHIRKKRSIGNCYSVVVMGLYILFCGIVRWQPYVGRYMLSYVALLCPLIGYQMQEFANSEKGENRRGAILAVVYVICCMELFSLTRYHQEEWFENAISRPWGYFAANKQILADYENILYKLREKGYDKIGIKLGGLDYEYAIWYMMYSPELQMEHVLVENESAKYEDGSFIPECLILGSQFQEEKLTVHGKEYVRCTDEYEGTQLSIYILQE